MTDTDASGGTEAMTFDRPLRYNDGQYEITLPAKLSDHDSLENSDTFAFIPELQQNTVRFRVVLTDDDEGRHVRRLRRAGEHDQTYLRFPAEMAVERGWDHLLEAEDSVRVEIRRVDRGDYIVNTWPRTQPWFATNVGDAVADPVYKELVTVETGPDLEHKEYRLELPGAFADAYGLKPGTPVATRLTARGGELMLALDFDVDDSEHDDLHVRTIFRSGGTPTDGDYENEHFAVTVSKTYADALELPQRGLRVVPEQDQILLDPQT